MHMDTNYCHFSTVINNMTHFLWNWILIPEIECLIPEFTVYRPMIWWYAMFTVRSCVTLEAANSRRRLWPFSSVIMLGSLSDWTVVRLWRHKLHCPRAHFYILLGGEASNTDWCDEGAVESNQKHFCNYMHVVITTHCVPGGVNIAREIYFRVTMFRSDCFVMVAFIRVAIACIFDVHDCV